MNKVEKLEYYLPESNSEINWRQTFKNSDSGMTVKVYQTEDSETGETNLNGYISFNNVYMNSPMESKSEFYRELTKFLNKIGLDPMFIL